jgi:hypothetical protein
MVLLLLLLVLLLLLLLLRWRAAGGDAWPRPGAVYNTFLVPYLILLLEKVKG